MKTKKPKRRYYTAHEIRKDIARYQEKALKLQREAEAEEKIAAALYKKGPLHAELTGFHAETAEKLRQSAARIYDKKLPRLKEKLAEFDTDLLPGLGITDRSIEV